MQKYAKALVAIVGAALTAALGIFPAGSLVWTVLQVVAAALTAAGVYAVPNAAPAPAAPVAAPAPAKAP